MKAAIALLLGAIIGAVVLIGTWGKKQDPGNSSRQALDPVDTALMIYSKEIIVATAYYFCREHVPDTAAAVKSAGDKWMAKHSTVRTKKNLVLQDRMSRDELLGLAATSRQQNEAALQVMVKAPLSERTKWCKGAPIKFLSSEFDLSGNPDVVAAITNYKPSAQ